MRPKTAAGWTALTLGVLLITSNLWWIHRAFDDAMTASYLEDQLRWNQEALSDTLALIPAIQPLADKAEISAFLQHTTDFVSFEKDGCVWFRNIGIRFDQNDRVVHVARGWNFGEDDICFPK